MNNKNNDKIFFKIWRNKYINNEIFKKVKLFKKHCQLKSFKNFKQLNSYEFKDYLYSIYIEHYENEDKILFENEKFEIPSSVKWLALSDEFDQKLYPGQIPNTIEHLKLGRYFNFNIDNVLPSSLISIQFGIEWNQPINNKTFPKNIKSIKFGEHFNQPILPNVLPNSLEEIKFGYHWNQPLLINSLPYNLKSLEIGYLFNQLIEPGHIPLNCKKIILKNHKYDFELIEGVIPIGLLYLVFGFSFNQELKPNLLPYTIEYLEFGFNFNNGFKPLEYESIPKNCKKLIFSAKFNNGIDSLKNNYKKQFLKPLVLPIGLTHLVFGRDYCQYLIKDSLPFTLRCLELGENFKSNGYSSLKGIIPPNVIEIKYDYRNNLQFDESTLKYCKIIKGSTIQIENDNKIDYYKYIKVPLRLLGLTAILFGYILILPIKIIYDTYKYFK